ncbi:carbon-nitrogen hydrolase family protein [Pseudorhizobium pelagicum]|uniref:Hydrolase n=1 Tax=Pseudorhizobium pelagicum TaxID=1509405 RepID=A0A922P402_9HYPH|nr:carbon-nitrogen hydrolase family protein [Pseudorhizobium pelagicum]KEQ08967.1 hydrolase [Pseudorhizobium pelagicum]KEQ09958.1 hydrolase [Pseudorhizobium pelagicum]
MKIAAAQTYVSADISANGSAIRQVLCELAAKGVRVVNFCEGALSGYSKSQILHPDAWHSFDWQTQEAELRSVSALCQELNIFAVVGGAHPLTMAARPHNSLYVCSPDGGLLTRYDKRFLSHSEINDWYTPGTKAITFEVDSYRFGCAICIESQFPEVFAEYERLGVDAVLFSSYGIPEHFQIALRAHAGLNCIWISGATPAQKAAKGPAGIIGPDGSWVSRSPDVPDNSYALAVIDRNDPSFDIPLQKARPWRARAREGQIYRDKMVSDARSSSRSEY